MGFKVNFLASNKSLRRFFFFNIPVCKILDKQLTNWLWHPKSQSALFCVLGFSLFVCLFSKPQRKSECWQTKMLTFDFWRKLSQVSCHKESQLLIQVTGQSVNVPGANSCPAKKNKQTKPKEQWVVITFTPETEVETGKLTAQEAVMLWLSYFRS